MDLQNRIRGFGSTFSDPAFMCVLFWIVGLLGGSIFAGSDELLLANILPQLRIHSTIVPCLLAGWLILLTLPLIFRLLCFPCFGLICLLAFCKAFLFSFIQTGCLQVLGSGGWLFGVLLQFSSFALCVPLLDFWFSCFHLSAKELCFLFLRKSFVFTIVIIFDVFFTSLLLARLF